MSGYITTQKVKMKRLYTCAGIYHVFYERKIELAMSKDKNLELLLDFLSFDYPSITSANIGPLNESIYNTRVLDDMKVNASSLLCDIVLTQN